MPFRFIAIFLLLLAGLSAGAQQVLPVPKLSGQVIDQTGTLKPAEAEALTQQLAAIEQQRGAQIVVLMVDSTQPEDIATYAQRVADTWKVGRRDVGDGLVIVVAKRDRRINIQVAKALEGAVPDLLASRIIERQIKPAFKAGDFAGGLQAAVGQLDRALAGEALPAPEPTPKGRQSPARSTGIDLQSLGVFLFVGAPIAGAVLSSIFGRKLGALVTGGAMGGLAWFFTASLLLAGGAALLTLLLVGLTGFGSGRRSAVGAPVIWGGGHHGGGFGGMGGGGGFSSGGGGNFGGGGASGSW